MKCPMSFKTRVNGAGEPILDAFECLGGDCVWWMHDERLCMAVSLAIYLPIYLRHLGEELETIRRQYTHQARVL